MAIARDPRNNRRRRVLRDQAEEERTQSRSRTSRSRNSAEDAGDLALPRRGAGYSQEVRRACGARLVQLIPVRKRSFVAAVLVSLLVPTLLLTAHYMIYVSGSLQWYGHPLAISLDASHPSSIAAWFSSHVWLLCLGTTVLTFQLRRHKLDDYDGEYRLWFWMVLTCLLASIDATTHLSELLGLALDRWSQRTLGWSGQAVVEATLATLIGLLGLRLCSELKTVPVALLFWLAGLVAWAGSAALAQDELRLEISLQLRIWLKVALWLGGLTAIWLAALTYLRSVYMEAQQRFLARGRLAQRHAIPLRQRLRDSLPSFQRDEATENEEEGSPSRWRLPSFRRTRDPEGEQGESNAQRKRRERQERAEQRKQERIAAAEERKSNQQAKQTTDEDGAPEEKREARSRGLGRFLKRRARDEAAVTDSDTRAPAAKASDKTNNDKSSAQPRVKKGWTSWIPKPKDSDEPEEFQKVQPVQHKKAADTEEQDASPAEKKRGWFSRRKSASTAQSEDTGEPNKPKKGFFSRFTLQPPTEEEESDSGLKPVDRKRTDIPSTNAEADEEDSTNNRPMSKAERRRLRRMRQNNAA